MRREKTRAIRVRTERCRGTRGITALLCCLALAGGGCRGRRSQVLPGASAAPVGAEVLFADTSTLKRVLRGIYGGSGEWRWTGPDLAFSLDPPRDSRNVYLELDFNLPNEVASKVAPVVLTAKVNGTAVGKVSYAQEGRYYFSQPVPSEALARRPAAVEFQVDKSVKDAATGRALSLIVVSAALREYEDTMSFRDAQLSLAHEGYEETIRDRNLWIPLRKQNEMMRLFHELPVWEHTWFHSVRIIKNPLDLWMMQQIVYEVRPDFVIETGT
jgi:hypothetical protein